MALAITGAGATDEGLSCRPIDSHDMAFPLSACFTDFRCRLCWCWWCCCCSCCRAGFLFFDRFKDWTGIDDDDDDASEHSYG